MDTAPEPLASCLQQMNDLALNVGTAFGRQQGFQAVTGCLVRSGDGISHDQHIALLLCPWCPHNQLEIDLRKFCAHVWSRNHLQHTTVIEVIAAHQLFWLCANQFPAKLRSLYVTAQQKTFVNICNHLCQNIQHLSSCYTLASRLSHVFSACLLAALHLTTCHDN